jgi:hypothetical protein
MKGLKKKSKLGSNKKWGNARIISVDRIRTVNDTDFYDKLL